MTSVLINVDRTEVSQRGQRNRRPWTKYIVYGQRIDGSPIAPDGKPVFTFDNLPKGEVDVTLESFTRQGASAPESWTVKKVKPATAQLTPGTPGPAFTQGTPDGATAQAVPTQIIDRDELEDLRDRVEQLERFVRRIMTKVRLEERNER